MKQLIIIVALLLALSGAQAADLDEAKQLYGQGAMAAAAKLARSVGTADGYALAAQATLVDAVYLADRASRADLFAQAAEDARLALALDSHHVDAHLQLAMALGQIADRDPITAHFKGYAHEGKTHLDRALALAPDYPWAHGLLGIWHLQIVKHASSALADRWYGATQEAGLRHCAKAAELGPDILAVQLGCAVSMLELDPKRYRPEVMQKLATITRMPADDAAERLVRDEAHRLIAELS